MKNHEPTPRFFKSRLMLACNFARSSFIFIMRFLEVELPPNLRFLVHAEALDGDPDGGEGGEEGEVEDVGGGGEGEEEEPEPQDDEDDLVVHVDGEDADRVDDLDARPRPAHPHVAVDQTFWQKLGYKGKRVHEGLHCFVLAVGRGGSWCPLDSRGPRTSTAPPPARCG